MPYNGADTHDHVPVAGKPYHASFRNKHYSHQHHPDRNRRGPTTTTSPRHHSYTVSRPSYSAPRVSYTDAYASRPTYSKRSTYPAGPHNEKRHYCPKHTMPAYAQPPPPPMAQQQYQQLQRYIPYPPSPQQYSPYATPQTSTPYPTTPPTSTPFATAPTTGSPYFALPPSSTQHLTPYAPGPGAAAYAAHAIPARERGYSFGSQYSGRSGHSHHSGHHGHHSHHHSSNPASRASSRSRRSKAAGSAGKHDKRPTLGGSMFALWDTIVDAVRSPSGKR